MTKQVQAGCGGIVRRRKGVGRVQVQKYRRGRQMVRGYIRALPGKIKAAIAEYERRHK